MKVIHQTCTELPQRWKSQYKDTEHWRGKPTLYGDAKDIYIALLEEKNLTPKRAKEIIGNDTWFDIACSFCGNKPHKLVQSSIHREVNICKKCLEDGLKNMESNV